MDAAVHNAYKAALSWYLDQGIDEALLSEPVNRFAVPPHIDTIAISGFEQKATSQKIGNFSEELAPAPTFLGASEAYQEAVKLAQTADSLAALRAAIAEFEGISLKRTATNMVFADGNPNAQIMIIGEAPDADDDRLGKPFAGASGQILDKILSCIALSRSSEDAKASVYLSNVLNWRPPGNRTPNQSEIDLSLPFIERHIQLIKPKLLVICGGMAAQVLLGRSDSLSRLRGKIYEYKVLTKNIGGEDQIIPSIVTYHPSFLIKTPSQKRAVWADALEIAQKIANFT